MPCGRCMPCRVKRARSWALRIMHETRSWDDVIFLTLTYDDNNLPYRGSLVKEHAQKFLKRLRRNTGKNIRYFLGAEYGDTTRRPHYHLIVFGLGLADRQQIEDCWGKGFVYLGSVTFDSACYVASYTLKKLTGERSAEYSRLGIIPEFSLMSRRPGIGYSYVESNKPFLKQNGFCIVKGSKVPLPRYYSDKVFTEAEKHILHSLRSEFHKEQAEALMLKSGAEYGYQAQDYLKANRHQHEVDLKAKCQLKRRKI